MIAQLAAVDTPAVTDTISEPLHGHHETSEADVKTEVAEVEVNEIQIDEVEHINDEPVTKRKSPIEIITPVAPQLGKRVVLCKHKPSTIFLEKVIGQFYLTASFKFVCVQCSTTVEDGVACALHTEKCTMCAHMMVDTSKRQ